LCLVIKDHEEALTEWCRKSYVDNFHQPLSKLCNGDNILTVKAYNHLNGLYVNWTSFHSLSKIEGNYVVTDNERFLIERQTREIQREKRAIFLIAIGVIAAISVLGLVTYSAVKVTLINEEVKGLQRFRDQTLEKLEIQKVINTKIKKAITLLESSIENITSYVNEFKSEFNEFKAMLPNKIYLIAHFEASFAIAKSNIEEIAEDFNKGKQN
jgi:hypothetical protein